jgi:hypothetical protein
MVSNESLSIAFLCLATNGEKEDFLMNIRDRYKDWYDSEKGILLQRALHLPMHYISEKIKCLQLALDAEKNGKKIWEDMANRIAGSCLKQFPSAMQQNQYEDE